jgi:hypothetical protein
MRRWRKILRTGAGNEFDSGGFVSATRVLGMVRQVSKSTKAIICCCISACLAGFALIVTYGEAEKKPSEKGGANNFSVSRFAPAVATHTGVHEFSPSLRQRQRFALSSTPRWRRLRLRGTGPISGDDVGQLAHSVTSTFSPNSHRSMQAPLRHIVRQGAYKPCPSFRIGTRGFQVVHERRLCGGLVSLATVQRTCGLSSRSRICVTAPVVSPVTSASQPAVTASLPTATEDGEP